jgi:hypothetical protein
MSFKKLLADFEEKGSRHSFGVPKSLLRMVLRILLLKVMPRSSEVGWKVVLPPGFSSTLSMKHG